MGSPNGIIGTVVGAQLLDLKNTYSYSGCCCCVGCCCCDGCCCGCICCMGAGIMGGPDCMMGTMSSGCWPGTPGTARCCACACMCPAGTEMYCIACPGPGMPMGPYMWYPWGGTPGPIATCISHAKCVLRGIAVFDERYLTVPRCYAMRCCACAGMCPGGMGMYCIACPGPGMPMWYP